MARAVARCGGNGDFGYGGEPRDRRRGQLVTVTVGVCSYQLAISDDTWAPELKSTRSQSVPDQVCTEKPESGNGGHQRRRVPVRSSATLPPASV